MTKPPLDRKLGGCVLLRADVPPFDWVLWSTSPWEKDISQGTPRPTGVLVPLSSCFWALHLGRSSGFAWKFRTSHTGLCPSLRRPLFFHEPFRGAADGKPPVFFFGGQHPTGGPAPKGDICPMSKCSATFCRYNIRLREAEAGKARRTESKGSGWVPRWVCPVHEKMGLAI